MRKTFFIAWIVLICLVPLVYYTIGENIVIAVLSGKAPPWAEELIQIFYPRFAVEKHRFTLSFFETKAEGVLSRFCLVQIALLGIALGYTYYTPFRLSLVNFWNKTASVSQVSWIRILFYAGVIGFTYDWAYFLELISPAAVFYKPVLLLKILSISFPSVKAIKILHGLLIIGCICVIFRIQAFISSIVVTLLFILLQGWLYSFEKIDHTFATLTYAILLIPCVVALQEKAIRTGQTTLAAWPLQLICVCITLVYCMAGLEKLLIAGADWITPQSFRSYLYLHQAPLGLWIAGSDVLCMILPVMAMLFQLGFISILFFPRLTPYFLLAGIGFHTGNYLLLQVGWYINAWIFVYIFFINWERTYQLVLQKLSRKLLHTKRNNLYQS